MNDCVFEIISSFFLCLLKFRIGVGFVQPFEDETTVAERFSCEVGARCCFSHKLLMQSWPALSQVSRQNYSALAS